MQDSQCSEFSSRRQKAGLTIEDTADLLQISVSAARKYESGETAPRIAELQALKGVGFASARTLEPEAKWFGLVDHANDQEIVLKSPKLRARQSELGQFLTPDSVSAFMAKLFPETALPVRLLDAGAGKGALSEAFIKRWRRLSSSQITVHNYEVDELVLHHLREVARELSMLGGVDTEIFEGDFIERAATMLRLGKGPRYTHAVLNPPYKKIGTGSRQRAFLSTIGLETVNLYSGFVGLAIALMEEGGELVAIVPRSFCNGPYYQPFRRFVLARAAIRHMHLFEARDKAFKRDRVLQENLIIRLTCGRPQGEVTISTSMDDTFHDYREMVHPFASIVGPNDADQFIHIPTGGSDGLLDAHAFRCTLDELELSVSTGPVVDFRMKNDLRANPEPGTVPLLYPAHFGRFGLQWPKPGFKKANAIAHTRETAKWLLPSGFYAVVRRFSSKEERRRIVASVVEPEVLQSEFIGFENHLNVIHSGKRPIEEGVARGIAAFLNTSVVDRYFRRFNGHTQVNAADLRIMRYPDRQALTALGEWAKRNPQPSQEAIDARISELA